MNMIQYLTFSVSNERFAIDVLKVNEIIPIDTITHIPSVKSYIKGVMNIRGSITPIIDMGSRLDLPKDTSSKKESIVIVSMNYDNEDTEIGFIVSKVENVFSKDINQLESTPIFGTKVEKRFIKNIAKVDHSFITILDIDEILNLDELSITTQDMDI